MLLLNVGHTEHRSHRPLDLIFCKLRSAYRNDDLSNIQSHFNIGFVGEVNFSSFLIVVDIMLLNHRAYLVPIYNGFLIYTRMNHHLT